MIDKFLRESDPVNHLEKLVYTRLLLICYFPLSIYGNCRFTLEIYISRLSYRSTFNQSVNHCFNALIYTLAFSPFVLLSQIFKKLLSLAAPSSSTSSSSAAAATTTMAKDNNNNNKDNDRNNNARQRQVREERERRRREAEEGASATAAAPALGTQRLFAQPRRAANPAVDVNVDELFVASAADAASSAPPAHPIFTPGQVEAALAMATATPLPTTTTTTLFSVPTTRTVWTSLTGSFPTSARTLWMWTATMKPSPPRLGEA